MLGLLVPVLLLNAVQAQTQTDTTLSTLTLSAGTLRPAFAAATTSYRAAVEHSVTQVTVSPTATSAGATIEYSSFEYDEVLGSYIPLVDADSGTAGQQVALAVGETSFAVHVTDGTARTIYWVTIERDSDQTWGWTPTRDINALHAARNRKSSGIWSDGTTLWVADTGGRYGDLFVDDKVFAYTLETGARNQDKEFDLARSPSDQSTDDNGVPGDIWSDGTTLWVLDETDKKLYAYELSSGTRQDGSGGTTDREFSLHSANGVPGGIWGDGTTLWVTDSGKIYAYALSDGKRQDGTDGTTNREFNFSGGDIWSDGTTLQAEPPGQCGREEESRVVHQATVVESCVYAVGVIRW